MENTATGLGLAVLGAGVAFSGLNLGGSTASATPAAFTPAAGPTEPTIVWYGTGGGGNGNRLYRAWSDGTVEVRQVEIYFDGNTCTTGGPCNHWLVAAAPNEGLNARADINFDERVDSADLGLLVAAWGDAPRNDYPLADCPLGLIP